MKKIIYIFPLILLFYFSYYFKNFPLFMLSVSFFILLGFFFKKINKNFLLILFSILMAITLIESTLFYLNTGKFVQINSGQKTLSDINGLVPGVAPKFSILELLMFNLVYGDIELGVVKKVILFGLKFISYVPIL